MRLLVCKSGSVLSFHVSRFSNLHSFHPLRSTPALPGKSLISLRETIRRTRIHGFGLIDSGGPDESSDSESTHTLLASFPRFPMTKAARVLVNADGVPVPWLRRSCWPICRPNLPLKMDDASRACLAQHHHPFCSRSKHYSLLQRCCHG